MMNKRAILCLTLLVSAAGCGGGGGGSGPTTPGGSAAPAGSSGAGSSSAGGTQAVSQAAGPPQTVTAGDTLSYSSYGMWNSGSAGGASNGPFATGSDTPYGALPKIGTASYAGNAVGTASDGTASRQLSGTFSATADFGLGTVAGGLTMSQLDASGNRTPYDSYNFTGGFAPNSYKFSGPITAVNNKALSGNVQGGIFGPQGQEMGGTFAMQGGGTSVIGAFGGATVPSITGGSVSGTVDFGTSTIGTTAQGGWSTLTGTPGTVSFPSGSNFGSHGTLTSGGSSGAVTGAFYGPSAAEVGAVFPAGGAASAIGAFGGPKPTGALSASTIASGISRH